MFKSLALFWNRANRGEQIMESRQLEELNNASGVGLCSRLLPREVNSKEAQDLGYKKLPRTQCIIRYECDNVILKEIKH